MHSKGREITAPEMDSIKLMRQLAKMAGVELGLFRRMVLVLDVDDAPRLFGEAYLPGGAGDIPLPSVDLKTEVRSADDPPIVVSTTTMQKESKM